MKSTDGGGAAAQISNVNSTRIHKTYTPERQQHLYIHQLFFILDYI